MIWVPWGPQMGIRSHRCHLSRWNRWAFVDYIDFVDDMGLCRLAFSASLFTVLSFQYHLPWQVTKQWKSEGFKPRNLDTRGGMTDIHVSCF